MIAEKNRRSADTDQYPWACGGASRKTEVIKVLLFSHVQSWRRLYRPRNDAHVATSCLAELLCDKTRRRPRELVRCLD